VGCLGRRQPRGQIGADAIRAEAANGRPEAGGPLWRGATRAHRAISAPQGRRKKSCLGKLLISMEREKRGGGLQGPEKKTIYLRLLPAAGGFRSCKNGGTRYTQAVDFNPHSFGARTLFTTGEPERRWSQRGGSRLGRGGCRTRGQRSAHCGRKVRGTGGFGSGPFTAEGKRGVGRRRKKGGGTGDIVGW